MVTVRSRGFTLLEMLVVLSIVALLLTIAGPRYFGSLQRSKEVVLQENLNTLRDTIERFHGDKGRYPDSLGELVEKGYLRKVPLDPITGISGSWVILPAGAGRAGIADVRSGAAGVSQDGVPYAAF